MITKKMKIAIIAMILLFVIFNGKNRMNRCRSDVIRCYLANPRLSINELNEKADKFKELTRFSYQVWVNEIARHLIDTVSMHRHGIGMKLKMKLN